MNLEVKAIWRDKMEIRKTNANDIETLMGIRLEMLRVVNDLSEEEEFDKVLVDCSREYFLHGDQTTVIALDCGKTIGCASIKLHKHNAYF